MSRNYKADDLNAGQYRFSSKIKFTGLSFELNRLITSFFGNRL